MARGDLPTSPLSYYRAADYQGRLITVIINWNTTTRALNSVVVHRDDGCVYHTIILDNPNDGAKAKPLPLPADGAGDITYTANQLNKQGLNTLDDIMAVQITAAP